MHVFDKFIKRFNVTFCFWAIIFWNNAVVEVAEKASEEKMESSTEQMGEDPKYGGEADEEKSESEGKSRKEGEVDEEAEFKEANAESSGDSEEKETAVENSDSEGKQEEIEAEEDAVDAEASDNETLVCIYLPFLYKTYDLL